MSFKENSKVRTEHVDGVYEIAGERIHFTMYDEDNNPTEETMEGIIDKGKSITVLDEEGSDEFTVYYKI